jgi:23S rRNA pseudouridine2605 synthase
VSGDRLQKIIARAGVTSRRKAEAMITAGRVAVNGEIVRELGSKADPAHDRITLDGQPLFEEAKRYILVNKPRRVLCSLRDRFQRPLITDLLGADVGERVYPAGRLDFDSEGLVLLTNDGALMEAITRPGRGVAKTYEVTVAGTPADEDLERLRRGVVLEAQPEWRPAGWQEDEEADEVESWQEDASVDDPSEGQRTLPCTIERIETDKADAGIGDSLSGGRGATAGGGLDDGVTVSCFRVTLHEGKKNQIRRMFALIGSPVHRLVRVAIGTLELADLPAGEYRSLSAREVESLRREVREP